MLPDQLFHRCNESLESLPPFLGYLNGGTRSSAMKLLPYRNQFSVLEHFKVGREVARCEAGSLLKSSEGEKAPLARREKRDDGQSTPVMEQIDMFCMCDTLFHIAHPYDLFPTRALKIPNRMNPTPNPIAVMISGGICGAMSVATRNR